MALLFGVLFFHGKNGIVLIVPHFHEVEKSFFSSFRKKITLFLHWVRILRNSAARTPRNRRQSRKIGGLRVRKYSPPPVMIPRH